MDNDSLRRQLPHTASWDPATLTTTTVNVGAPVAAKLSRDSKNISVGETMILPPAVNCPTAEVLEVVQQQEVIGASSSDYSKSEDEYTHIEEPTPVSSPEILLH